MDKILVLGFFVVGVDGGGFSNLGYVGGLVLVFVIGYWVVKEICWEFNLMVFLFLDLDFKDVESFGVSIFCL